VRHCADAAPGHHRVRCPLRPVAVELALQQRIHRRIEIERKPGRARDPQPPVEIEAARAIHEEFHLRAAEREGRGGIGVVEPGGGHGRGGGNGVGGVYRGDRSARRATRYDATRAAAVVRGLEVIDERAPRAGAVDAEIRAVQGGEIGHAEALGGDDKRCIGQIGPGILRQDLAHSRHIGQT